MKSIKAHRGFLVFLLCLAVVLPFRIFQLLGDTTPDSNSVAAGSVLSVVCTVLIMVSILAVYLVYRLQKGFPSRMSLPHSPLLGMISILLGVMIAWESLESLQFVNYGMEASAFRTYQILTFVQLFFGVFTVIYLICLLVCYFTSREGEPSAPPAVLSLAVPLWSCIRLVNFYMALTATAHLEEAFYDLVFICAASLFLMSHSRLVSSYSSESSGRQAYAFGLIAVLLFFSYAVPRLVAGLRYGINLMQTTPLAFGVDLFLSIYILLFLFRFPRCAAAGGPEKTPGDEPEETLDEFFPAGEEFIARSAAFPGEFPTEGETEPAAAELPEEGPAQAEEPPAAEAEDASFGRDEFDLDSILNTYRSDQ